MNGELQKAADASAVFFEVFREPYQGLLEQMTSALKPIETLSPESVESLHCRPARGCEDDCAICLGELKSGEQVTELACGHVYHRKCIGTWLTKCSKCCPLCMQPAQSCDAPAPVTQNLCTGQCRLCIAMKRHSGPSADIAFRCKRYCVPRN
ncbi:Rnf167 [Symbiodinium sp. CCMP2592]|nr:Rnf167 [Symbiodinium sp. CCMP2592]